MGRSAVHYYLSKTGQGRGRVGTNSNAKLKSVRFSTVAVKCRSIQESKQTTSDIPTTQHENYAGGKVHCSLFLLAPKHYLHSEQTSALSRAPLLLSCTYHKGISHISRGWLWIFWYCYVLGTWEVFGFRNCFFKCWSPVALQKPHRVTAELIWSSGDVMSHKLLGKSSNVIPVLRWQHKTKSRRTAGQSKLKVQRDGNIPMLALACTVPCSFS